jgi:hypothetical protein
MDLPVAREQVLEPLGQRHLGGRVSAGRMGGDLVSAGGDR